MHVLCKDYVGLRDPRRVLKTDPPKILHFGPKVLCRQLFSTFLVIPACTFAEHFCSKVLCRHWSSTFFVISGGAFAVHFYSKVLCRQWFSTFLMILGGTFWGARPGRQTRLFLIVSPGKPGRGRPAGAQTPLFSIAFYSSSFLILLIL